MSPYVTTALRAYAAERGVRLIGDVPIYVSDEGADLALHRADPVEQAEHFVVRKKARDLRLLQGRTVPLDLRRNAFGL